MRKRSPRERARWEHYRIRGQLMMARKILQGIQNWAHSNGYSTLESEVDIACVYIHQAQDSIPTHPSEEYLQRNS